MCVYACSRVCARAHECGTSVCAFGVWGVCSVYVLLRVLGVECIWFMLGHGACASVVLVFACL